MNITKEWLAQYLHLGFSGSPFFINPVVDNSLFDPRCAKRQGLDYEMFRLVFNKLLDLQPPVVCQLTSGWDTRTILSALLANKKRNIRCFTAALQEGDVRVAASICDHFGVAHQVYQPGSTPDIFSRQTNCVSFGCFQQANMAEIEKAVDYTIFLSGGLGNELWRARFNQRVKTQVQKNGGLLARALMRAFTATALYPYIPDIYTFDAPKILTNLINDQLRKAPAFVKGDAGWLSDWFVWQNVHAPPNTDSQLAQAKHITHLYPMRNAALAKLVYQDSITNRLAGKLQEYIIQNNCRDLMNFPFNPQPLVDLQHARIRLPPFDQLHTRQFFVPKRLEQYLNNNPNPLWIECLASLELSLEQEE